jgi:hypothetical protein
MAAMVLFEAMGYYRFTLRKSSMKSIAPFFISAVVLAGAGCAPVAPASTLSSSEPMIAVNAWPTSPQPNVPSANITVDSPLSYSQIPGNTIAVSGTARVFESQLNWELRMNDTVLQSGLAIANAPDIGQFGPYTFSVDVTTIPADTILTLEVFDYSAKDGSKENSVTVPLLR